MSNLENSTIAIQKSGRLTEGSLAWLNNTAGTDFPVSEAPFDACRELQDSSTGITVTGWSNGDTLKAVACGLTDLAICGSDKYEELVAPYKFTDPQAKRNQFGIAAREEKLGFGACRLVVAKQVGAELSPIKRIVTSYPKLSSLFAVSSELRDTIIDEYSGGIEMIGRRYGYDTVIDIVHSGKSLRLNGLREIGTLLESEAMLVERQTGDGNTSGLSGNGFEYTRLDQKLEVLKLAAGVVKNGGALLRIGTKQEDDAMREFRTRH